MNVVSREGKEGLIWLTNHGIERNVKFLGIHVHAGDNERHR
jgi:hypothetical protein